MSNTLTWGIIGTGAIAQTFTRSLKQSLTGSAVAVASRSRAKAEKFGNDFGLAKRYGSYEAMLLDHDVQAVYVATPHPEHAQWAIRAAEAGKHVLVEKPMGLNQWDVQAIIEAAIANDVLIMEAFMYRCHPQTAKLIEIIRNGAIGEVRIIQATFSFQSGFDAGSRLYNNDLAGGGILDVGCYTASMARLIAGAAAGAEFADPIDVKGTAHLGQTGVDEWATGVLRFPADILAQLSTGIAVNQENVVRVFGALGNIFIPNPWLCDRNKPDIGRILVHRNGKDAEEIICPAEVTSFTLEADVFGDAVGAGKKQAPAPAMSSGDSLGNSRTLDAWRESIGLIYNREKLENFPAATIANRQLTVQTPRRIPHGRVHGLQKSVARLVMGVDNQRTVPHARAIFDAYFEYGGNCFDTAYVYHPDHSRNLGQWIKARGVREQVALIVKGAHTPDCTPEKLSEQLRIMLEQRIKTDFADIYFLHRDNPDVPVGEFVEVLNEHVRAGLIKVFGGSNWSLARIQAANDYATSKGLQGFDVVSNNLSLARMVNEIWTGALSASDSESRAWFARNQLALFAWSSQARGFFTDHAHRDRALNSEEMNRCWYCEDNWQRRDRVLELAREKNVQPINIALAYVLNQPFPTFPLIGPRTLEELRTSLPALKIPLTAAELKWLNLEINARS
jgi:predicted dehydrogenase/aryl-alcohol dehydrogenase-like predicted oxidoreductase